MYSRIFFITSTFLFTLLLACAKLNSNNHPINVISKNEIQLNNTESNNTDTKPKLDPNPSRNGKPKPNLVPDPNAKANPNLNPDPNSKPNLVLDSNAKPLPDQNPDPNAKANPNTNLEPNQKPKPNMNADSNAKPNPDLNPKSNVNLEPNPKPKPNMNPDPKAKPNPNTKPVAKPKPNPESNHDQNSKKKPSQNPKPNPNPNPIPNPDPKANPNPIPNPDPKANPNPIPNPDPKVNPNPIPNPDPKVNPNPSQNSKANPNPNLNPIPKPEPINIHQNPPVDSIVDYFDTIDYDSGGTWDNEEDCPFRVSDHLWTRDIKGFKPPNCSEILTHPRPSNTRADRWIPRHPHNDASILELVKNCTHLKRLVAFPDRPATDEERVFPLAYIFVGERNADQTLRFFRSIYWPQNAYCFTYDNKSTPVYKQFMLSLSQCFANVVVNPAPMNVFWGQDSVLYNVMSCFQPLSNHTIPWRYMQIVSYNDFPLKTNLETVKIMQILNGSQDCDLVEPIVGYYYYYHDYKPFPGPGTNKIKPIPPDGLILFKGSYATTMTREFVRFVLDNPASQKLYKWMDGTWCPEEHYWPTLIHNLRLGAPGAFPGHCLWYYMHKKKKKPYLSRCQVWEEYPTDGHRCLGKHRRWSCVYGVDDIPWLLQRYELIAHKLYGEFQPAALYCLEKWHWSKTCSKSTKYVDINVKFYENLPNVKYQNAVDKDEFRC